MYNNKQTDARFDRRSYQTNKRSKTKSETFNRCIHIVRRAQFQKPCRSAQMQALAAGALVAVQLSTASAVAVGAEPNKRWSHAAATRPGHHSPRRLWHQMSKARR